MAKLTLIEKRQKLEALQPMLKAMYKEFSDLSKKKPEGAVSKTKIAIVNRLLKEINDLLKGEPSIRFLDFLNEDDVPQYSDVALVLSQYFAAMESFRDTIENEEDFED